MTKIQTYLTEIKRYLTETRLYLIEVIPKNLTIFQMNQIQETINIEYLAPFLLHKIKQIYLIKCPINFIKLHVIFSPKI